MAWSLDKRPSQQGCLGLASPTLPGTKSSLDACMQSWTYLPAVFPASGTYRTLAWLAPAFYFLPLFWSILYVVARVRGKAHHHHPLCADLVRTPPPPSPHLCCESKLLLGRRRQVGRSGPELKSRSPPAVHPTATGPPAGEALWHPKRASSERATASAACSVVRKYASSTWLHGPLLPEKQPPSPLSSPRASLPSPVPRILQDHKITRPVQAEYFIFYVWRVGTSDAMCTPVPCTSSEMAQPPGLLGRMYCFADPSSRWGSTPACDFCLAIWCTCGCTSMVDPACPLQSASSPGHFVPSPNLPRFICTGTGDGKQQHITLPLRGVASCLARGSLSHSLTLSCVSRLTMRERHNSYSLSWPASLRVRRPKGRFRHIN